MGLALCISRFLCGRSACVRVIVLLHIDLAHCRDRRFNNTGHHGLSDVQWGCDSVSLVKGGRRCGDDSTIILHTTRGLLDNMGG